jgi:hypothetical protein
LANQAYANVLLSPTAMTDVARVIAKAKVARVADRLRREERGEREASEPPAASAA